MKVSVTVSDPKLIWAAPVNESTRKWGVCAIPRMWRRPDGSLIIRVNGEQDTCFVANLHQERNHCFLSADNGESWEEIDEKDVDRSVVTSTEPPYVRLPDGRWLARRFRADEKPDVTGLTPVATVYRPSKETRRHVYRYMEIPPEIRQTELVTYDGSGRELSCEPMTENYPELFIGLEAGAQYRDGKAVLVEEYVPIPERMSLYAVTNSFVPLPDGTLGALVHGQDPAHTEDFFDLVYFAVSADGGRSWSIRSVPGIATERTEWGYTEENTLTVAPNGSLLVAMRTEMCVPEDVQHYTGTMFCRSVDGGRTWTKPVELTDSSVTPHLITLANGVVVLCYGRPGVHLIYSTDNGLTWSEPITLIGKTLKAFRAEGVAYMDCKYWDQDSYCNIYMDAVSEDSVLVCYNDMKYDPGDGLRHRASLTRKVTFRRSEV